MTFHNKPKGFLITLAFRFLNKKTMKGQITNEPFEIIKSSDILTELDLSRLKSIKGQELVENFKKSQVLEQEQRWKFLF